MTYISYNQREDAQDDVLRILAGFVLDAKDAFDTLDSHRLWRGCRFIFGTFKGRLDVKHRERCEELLASTREQLWSVGRTNDPVALSAALDETLLLYDTLCEYFNVKGLLLRMESDLDTLVARRSA